MIITQTPLRIGLLGGGTDLPAYYREHGGRVLNCALDKYVYVIVKQRFDDDIYVNYSKKEIVSSVADIEHELVREAMLMTGVDRRRRDHHPGRHSIGRFRARIVLGGDRRTAARVVRVSRRPGVGRGAGRAGVHDRDRTVREADREAGSIHRRPRRDPRHPLRARRGVVGRGDRYLAPRAPARPPGAGHALLHGRHPKREHDSARAAREHRVDARPQLDRFRDLAGVAVDALRDGDIEAVGTALRESWEAKRKLARGRLERVRSIAPWPARWTPAPPARRSRAPVAAASCSSCARSSASARCAGAWPTCASCPSSSIGSVHASC